MKRETENQNESNKWLKILKKFGNAVIFVLLVVIGTIVVISMLPMGNTAKLLVVQSGSMAPTIPTGSLLLSIPTKSYKVGDIITFRNKRDNLNLVTHRIIEEIGYGTYKTQGDANEDPDAIPIQLPDIHGKASFHLPYVGYIINFTKSKTGLITVLIIPSIIIAIEEILSIKKEISAMRLEKNVKDN